MFGLLENLSDKESSFKFAAGLGVLMIFCMYSIHNGIKISTNNSVLLRNLYIGMIYKKLLRVTQNSIQEISIGKIMNIIANDLNVFDIDIWFVFYVFTYPVTIIGYFIVMWNIIGIYSILGFAIIFLGIFISHSFNQLSEKYKKAKNPITDERVKMIAMTIDEINLIKMQGWEFKIIERINSLRSKEIKALKTFMAFDLINRKIGFNYSFLAGFITVVVYYTVEGSISPSQVFSLMFMFSFMRLVILRSFVTVVRVITEIKILVQRITEIMRISEVNFNQNLETENSANSIEIENITAGWKQCESKTSQETDRFKISSYNASIEINSLEVAKGSLTMVLGKTGSGKSNFLQFLINEMHIIVGSLRISGNYCLVEQSPIIFRDSIKGNILFGKPLNETLLSEILKITCLNDDLDSFPQGIDTELGEKGITLSGGQKVRISLARALYSDCEIFLLDDILSALDANVSNKIFEGVIMKFLKNKTVILVTHSVQYVEFADNILVFDNGKIVEKGTSNVIMERNPQLLSYSSENNPTFHLDREKEENQYIDLNKGTPDYNQEKSVKLVEEEGKEQRGVSFSTYLYFFSNMKPVSFIFLFLLLHILGKTGLIVSSRLLGEWSEGSLNYDEGLLINVVVFTLSFSFLMINPFFFSKITLNSSRNIHSFMVSALLKAKTVFFDKNPSGRILNRFSNDIGTIDIKIITTFFEISDGFFQFLPLFLNIWIVEPYLIIASIVQLILSYFVVKFYNYSLIKSKELDLIARSPICTHINSSLNGLKDIRLYNQEKMFLGKMDKLLLDSCNHSVNFWNISRILGFTLDYIANLTGIIGVFILIGGSNNTKSSTGFVIFMILIVCEHFQFFIRKSIYLSNLMASTERCREYKLIESEKQIIKIQDERKIPPDWPSKGEFYFKEVSMKYRSELEFTLKDISFQIKSGEKVACVGRTGSGKSTFVQIIMRMREHEKGLIILDKVDISKVGLHRLRKSISVIPQNSHLLLGTIKENIDPFGLYSEKEIWIALEKVQLSNKVQNLKEKLEYVIDSTNNYFSSGEVQLLCLARALLKKSCILVLDEATSNLDIHSENLIQE